MNQAIFSIYDSAAEAYITPFFMPKAAQALRVFRQMLNDDSHQFSNSPADYTLFKLGEFDIESGEIQYEIPISLGNGLQFMDLNNAEVPIPIRNDTQSKHTA